MIPKVKQKGILFSQVQYIYMSKTIPVPSPKGLTVQGTTHRQEKG